MLPRAARALSSLSLAREEQALLTTSLWSMAVRLLGMGASFVMGVLLARWLTPAGFGAYGIIIAMALMLSVLAQFGLPTIATREISIALAKRRWSAMRGYIHLFVKVAASGSFALAVLWICFSAVFPGLVRSFGANLIGALLVPLFALTVLVSAELRALDRVVLGQSLEVTLRPALMCALLHPVREDSNQEVPPCKRRRRRFKHLVPQRPKGFDIQKRKVFDPMAILARHG